MEAIIETRFLKLELRGEHFVNNSVYLVVVMGDWFYGRLCRQLNHFISGGRDRSIYYQSLFASGFEPSRLEVRKKPDTEL